MYAIHDDQSNKYLAKSEFLNILDILDQNLENTIFSCLAKAVL